MAELPEHFRKRHNLIEEEWDEFEFLAYAIQMRVWGTEVSSW